MATVNRKCSYGITSGGQEHWEEDIFSPSVLLSHDLKAFWLGDHEMCSNSLCYATAEGKGEREE